MDCEEETLNKCCYKCTVQPIEDLSIYHNPANSTTVLWNKYQVFFYENLDFAATTRIFASEYQISDILLTNNFLLCIDGNGNVHVTVLKFKSSTQVKQMKITFQPRENNIKTFLQYTEDLILSLKYVYDTYFLCLHKLTAEFKITKKTILVLNKNWPVTEEKSCKIIKTPLNEEIFTEFNRKTKEKYQFIDRIKAECDLVLISLNRAVYYCIFSSKMPVEEIELMKLYFCPSNVKNIEVTNSNFVLISLSIGTVIRLNLAKISAPPDIIHLNMAIEMLVAINDMFVYTDGVSLWKTENAFTEKLKFKDLCLKHVKDLSVYKNQIICTTYTKLIYLIPFNSGSLIETVNSAKILVNNSDYLENIFIEIEKNNELVKILNKEQNYILATALSNRQDVINNVKIKIIVYDQFHKLQEKDVAFTEDLSQYFEPDIYIFLIRLKFDNTCQQIYNILSNIAEISTLNITIISNENILKILSIKLESLKNINYIIPVTMKNISTDFYIEIKIISNIPRAFDGQNDKIILFKQIIILRSEHFIRIPTDNYQFLKIPTESIENLIIPANNINKQTKDWSLYIKLPTNYKERFKNIDFSNENLNETKILYINQQFNNDEYLNSQNKIIFLVGKEKVALEIVNDGFSEPMLKILSRNLEKAFDIRQFVSRLIYKDDVANEKQLINWNFYATTENLHKSIKNAITSSDEPEEEIHKLKEMFEKNIIGYLPL